MSNQKREEYDRGLYDEQIRKVRKFKRKMNDFETYMEEVFSW